MLGVSNLTIIGSILNGIRAWSSAIADISMKSYLKLEDVVIQNTTTDGTLFGEIFI